MKKLVSFLISASFLIIACNKEEQLPTYKSSVPVIFSVNSRMSHTIDTVNLGDTIYLTASGTIADTANTFSSSFKMFTGNVSASGAFTSSGNLAGAAFISPLPRLISAPVAPSALFGWVAPIAVPCPPVAHKTNILISGSFENSVSLSSQLGNQSASDSKPIYVR